MPGPTSLIERRNARVLYLSYSGLLDPLGQSQVLQYLVGLSSLGHRVTLVTYEKPDEWANSEHRRATEDLVAASGIQWVPLTYHQRPRWPATLFDVWLGFVVAFYQVLRRRADIVHVRGYVLAPIALLLKVSLGTRFLFDPRSFWPDELVEIGAWKAQSLPHRLTKRIERWLLRSADGVVCLTHAALATIRAYPYMNGKGPRFAVITTCANLDLFRPSVSSEAPVVPFTLGYLGTAGTPYLLDEFFEAFKALKGVQPDAHCLIVNRRDHVHIETRRVAAGLEKTDIEVVASTHRHVVEQLQRMSAGVVFITPTPCRKACAPTKLGELLAAGIPCMANAGVGDVERILLDKRVGIVVSDFSHASLRDGIGRLLSLCAEPGVKERCVAVAHEHFSLADGIAAYDSLYGELVGAHE